MKRNGAECISFGLKQHAESGFAERDCALKYCLEDRRKIAEGAADDAQYLCERRSLLMRLLKFARLAVKLILQIANGPIGSNLGCCRVFALRPQRLAVPHFRGFSAYRAAPSHVALPVANDLRLPRREGRCAAQHKSNSIRPNRVTSGSRRLGPFVSSRQVAKMPLHELMAG
jgi:hypothetical protein